MYVCIYTYIYIYTYTCIYIYISLSLYIYIFVSFFTFVSGVFFHFTLKISMFQKTYCFDVFHLQNRFSDVPDGYFDTLDRYKNYKKNPFLDLLYLSVFCL